MSKSTYDIKHEGNDHRNMTLDGLRAAGVPEEVILAGVKAALCAEVDAAAERARMGWITAGVGQSMEYDLVERQADAAIKAPSTATAAKFPMLAATIGIDIDPSTGEAAADVLGVARCVQAQRDAWIGAGAVIREARLKAKAAITAAADIEVAASASATGISSLSAL